MSKTQSERITALEEALAKALVKINELATAQQPIAQRVNEAHCRIDDAGKMFSALRRTLTPKREPLSTYIEPGDFDAAVKSLRDDADDEHARFPIAAIRERAVELAAALAELRDEAGDDRAKFTRAEIDERFCARRTLRENTAAAA